MARFTALILVALTLTSPVFGKEKDKPKPEKKNRGACKVELVKEASAGSILIAFDTDSEEECKKAGTADSTANFEPKKPAPSGRR